LGGYVYRYTPVATALISLHSKESKTDTHRMVNRLTVWVEWRDGGRLGHGRWSCRQLFSIKPRHSVTAAPWLSSCSRRRRRRWCRVDWWQFRRRRWQQMFQFILWHFDVLVSRLPGRRSTLCVPDICNKHALKGKIHMITTLSP